MDTTYSTSPEGETKSARIQWGLTNKRCPYCGRDLIGVKVTGSGRFEDGQFCSLDCYTYFHYSEYIRASAAR